MNGTHRLLHEIDNILYSALERTSYPRQFDDEWNSSSETENKLKLVDIIPDSALEHTSYPRQRLATAATRRPCAHAISVLKFACMTGKKKTSRQPNTRTNLPPATQTVLAFFVPVIVALFVGTITGSLASGSNAPVLGTLGLAGWFLGLAFYGVPGMGLRGGRPLFAGIGFATLGWIAFLLIRALFIPINPEPEGSTRAFIYFLLFESFAVQLWLFGLFFRATAVWRGPLSAAILSGIVFGATAVLFFQNITITTLITLIYYTALGIFYGIIRLRTGSFLGTAVIFALQSFTAWVALGPFPADTAATQLLWVYGLTTPLLALFTWRLWPKEESDYRV